MKLLSFDIIIVGGGAAGFFTAINAAEMAPHKRICILERGKEVLTKVRISGGGRCNVTHAEFLPKALSQNYPRGEKELFGPFHSFMTGDTIEWFEQRGVKLKTEEDGRMFPESNSSETIIDLFLRQTEQLGIKVFTKRALKELEFKNNQWEISTSQERFTAQKVLMATGSNPKVWDILSNLGHRIIPGVPSLFSFNITDQRIKELSGVATDVIITVRGEKHLTLGPLLITHWGISGPAVLKLSAWAARALSTKKNFEVEINWLPEWSIEEILKKYDHLRRENGRQVLQKFAQFDLPKRLWHNLVLATGIAPDTRWADLNKKQMERLTHQLTNSRFQVHGKSTYKEEFVTAGGVALKEVNFKTFESKICKNLFLAGEVLNIDAITGGFNFQNAWTGGYLAARAMTSE